MPWMQPQWATPPTTTAVATTTVTRQRTERGVGGDKNGVVADTVDRSLAAMMGRALALSHNLCLFLPRNANKSRVKQCWWKAFMRADDRSRSGRRPGEETLTGE